MGRKPQAEQEAAAESALLTTVDPPIVVALKKNDDEYLAIEKELQKEVQKLRTSYQGRFDKVLADRKQILDAEPADAKDDDEEKDLATPSCKGFWFTCLKRLPGMTDEIEEHDATVLEYLSDIKAINVDPEDETKGFRLEFIFKENQWFFNESLSVELSTNEHVYNKEWTCTKMRSSTIDWKPDMDITVEKVAKKVKGGGAKKKKAKDSIEPRDSFFRSIFRTLKVGDPIPADISGGMADELEGEEDEFLQEYLDNQMQLCQLVKDALIPHAVRVYTGEAFPEDDDDDDDYDDDEESEEEDEEESEEEIPTPKKGKAKKGSPKKKGDKKEDCKQQ